MRAGAATAPRLIVIKNPFERRERNIIALPVGESTVAALVGEYIPAGVDVDVSVNGLRIDPASWAERTLAMGEELLITPRVGNGGLKGILSAALMIAVMVYAPEIAFSAYGAAGGAMAAGAFAASTAGMLLTAGVGAHGGLLIGGGRA